jgi:dTDP-4-dehydrorhamnose reductase
MSFPILLTGKDGQVGRELTTLLPRFGDVSAFARNELDLTKPEQIRDVVRSVRPRLIVNAAAYTAVDRAESEEAAAHAVNAIAPALLAEEAKKVGAAIVHYSTDYVFDGSKRAPYTEKDAPNPQNVYGRTKLAGEQAIREAGVAHLIFRTAWVYAREGHNFLHTILKLATEREELRIVSDQIGAPTWSHEIAAATTGVLAKLTHSKRDLGAVSQASATYHMTAGGETSWFHFAEAILEEAGNTPPDEKWFRAVTAGKSIVTKRIIPITSSEYPTPARRPAYSVLSNERLAHTFNVRLSNWREQLHALFAGSGQ